MQRNIFKVQAAARRATNSKCPVRAVPTQWSSSADNNPAPSLGSGLRVPTVTRLFLVLLLTIATPRLSYAQVQLPAVNLGETNFEDGFASPGWILEEFPDSYIAGERRNGNGSRIPGQNRLVTAI
jgi:hypothetical protein